MLWVLLLTAALADPPRPPIPMPPGDLIAHLADAPLYGDWYRFPPPEVVRDARRVNVAFRSKMEKEKPSWPEHEHRKFDAAIRYAEWSYKAWDTLDDAQRDGYSWWTRRLKMKQLRTIIGADTYADGEMPPALPYWMFRDLD